MNNQNDKQEESLQTKQLEHNKSQVDQNSPITYQIIHNGQEQTSSQTQNRSSKLKKQENKKYSKRVEDYPDHFRVDMQICDGIYQIYRKLNVRGRQRQNFSFQQMKLANQTMNYQKIIEIFKDIKYRLSINQKLVILRSLKKFCFNQNFINKEQFGKIYKVIVHRFDLEQTIFKQVIQTKYASAAQKSQSFKKSAFDVKLNKSFSYKLKTQPIVNSIEHQSPHRNIETISKQNKNLRFIKDNLNDQLIKKLERMKHSPILEKNQIFSPVKDLSQKRTMTETRNEKKLERKYQSRIIQKNKLSKITWQKLFKINEKSSYQNICIPQFLSQNFQDDIYF